MLKIKKTITVFGLSAFAIILVVVLMAMSQPAKQTDALNDTDVIASNVTPNEIDETTPAPVTAAPEVKPSEIVKPEPTAEAKGNDIPLTVIEDKPEPPELPDTAYTGEQTDDATTDDVQAYEALDPALKNPDVKPTTTPAPVEPAKPKETTPQSGDKNNKGEVYIPGFGWVKDEGGGGQGEKSVGEGSLDVMVGH